MNSLFECMNCGMVATRSHDECPACGRTCGSNERAGKAFRRVDARDFMDLIQG